MVRGTRNSERGAGRTRRKAKNERLEEATRYRSYRYTDKKRKDFLYLLEQGNTISFSCEVVGVSRDTELRVRRADKEYSDAVETALGGRDELVEDAVFATALGGDVQAQKFWLTNRARKRWRSGTFLELPPDPGAGGDGPLEIREIVVHLTQAPPSPE